MKKMLVSLAAATVLALTLGLVGCGGGNGGNEGPASLEAGLEKMESMGMMVLAQEEFSESGVSGTMAIAITSNFDAFAAIYFDSATAAKAGYKAYMQSETEDLEGYVVEQHGNWVLIGAPADVAAFLA